MCEKAKKGKVVSSTGTYFKNVDVAKNLFFNKVKMEEGRVD